MSLTLESLHPTVVEAAGGLFADGHYGQAVFEAFKAVEVRIREETRLDMSGRQLVGRAFAGTPPAIDVTTQTGRSGTDEQEGFKLLFMGAMQGIRNPEGHAFIPEDDPHAALEYLALASLLMRRLDAARRPQG